MILEGGTVSYQGITNAEGRADLGVVPTGSGVGIVATLEGYEDFSTSYTVPEEAGDEVAVNVNMSPTVIVSENGYHDLSLLQ